jgi:hypothetical protein
MRKLAKAIVSEIDYISDDLFHGNKKIREKLRELRHYDR